jgi:pyridoxal phosphate enzyme (YggS family)
LVNSIGERVAEIRNAIEEALAAGGRSGESVKLLGVSKFHPAEMMAEAAPYVDMLGENRVQEATAKRARWPQELSTPWHLIGHLQRNKARRALEIFDAIESVDSLDLARMLDRILAEKERSAYPIFIEVNTSGEATKHGVDPREADGLLSMILETCPRLTVEGLMTVGPNVDDESAVRASFSQLRELRAELSSSFGIPMPELSMGMSGDYRIAVEEGSTIVRIGTAIFGPRNGYPV